MLRSGADAVPRPEEGDRWRVLSRLRPRPLPGELSPAEGLALIGQVAGFGRHTAPTRDGKGIVFVSHDGQVYPAGFLPLSVGSVRGQPLAAICRDDPLLCSIRAARFTGRCGTCEYADLCGGSRARAYAASRDPLGEDPACPYRGCEHPLPALSGVLPAGTPDGARRARFPGQRVRAE